MRIAVAAVHASFVDDQLRRGRGLRDRDQPPHRGFDVGVGLDLEQSESVGRQGGGLTRHLSGRVDADRPGDRDLGEQRQPQVRGQRPA